LRYRSCEGIEDRVNFTPATIDQKDWLSYVHGAGFVELDHPFADGIYADYATPVGRDGAAKLPIEPKRSMPGSYVPP
jgi:hypothetical protein